MPFGGRLPTGPLRQMVRQQSVPVTVNRGDAGDDGYGGQGNYSELGTRMLLLFAPNSRRETTLAGDDIDADLEGMMLPSVDVAVGDRVERSEAVYEVEVIDPLPNSQSVAVKQLSLSRV